MSKAQLRREISKLVGGLSKAEVERQSEIIGRKLLEHPKFKLAQKVSIYLSTNNEVDTVKILKLAIEIHGKQCFVPLVRKRELLDQNGRPMTRMVMVRLNSMAEYAQLPLNQYKIREPEDVNVNLRDVARPDSENHLDLLIAPGLAFSMDGRRLGHGKGYYDEYLFDWLKMSRKKPLYTIGLALKEQIVDNPLADGKHDYVLDEIITV